MIVPVAEEELEINIDDFFLPELDFPKRPSWSFEMSKEELDARENRYFSVSQRHLGPFHVHVESTCDIHILI